MTNIVRATIVVQDAKGHRATCGWYYDLDSTATDWTDGGNQPSVLSGVLEYHKNLLLRLDTLLAGQIVDSRLSIAALPSGLKIAPEAASDVEEKARLIITSPNGRAVLRTDIPAFDHALFSSEVNVTDAAGFVALLTNATEAWSAEYGCICDARGITVTEPSIRRVFVAR